MDRVTCCCGGVRCTLAILNCTESTKTTTTLEHFEFLPASFSSVAAATNRWHRYFSVINVDDYRDAAGRSWAIITVYLSFSFSPSLPGPATTATATFLSFRLTDLFFRRSLQVDDRDPAKVSRGRTSGDCWYQVSTGRMVFLSPNEQRRSTKSQQSTPRRLRVETVVGGDVTYGVSIV